MLQSSGISDIILLPNVMFENSLEIFDIVLIPFILNVVFDNSRSGNEKNKMTFLLDYIRNYL
jgi:hypothetical protein